MYYLLALLVLVALALLFQFLAMAVFIQKLIVNLVMLAFLLAEASYESFRFLYRLVIPFLPGALRSVWNIILMMVYLPDRIIDFLYAHTTQSAHVDYTSDFTFNAIQQCAGLRKDNARCIRQRKVSVGQMEAPEVFYCWQHQP